MFDKVIIVDESIAPPQPAVLNATRPTAFIPIFSTRGYGKDSTLKLFEGQSQSELLRRYGDLSLSVNLAPLSYAYEFLRGGGDVYIRRITSSTANYAHAVIIAKGRVNTETSKFEVKYVVQTIANTTDLDGLLTAAEALYSTVADVDGYKTYPIAVVGLNWSGVEGNRYTFRLLSNKALEKAIPQRGYQLEVRKSSSASPSSVSFAINEDAMLDGETVYANDYVEEQDPDIYFKMLSTYNQYLAAIETYIPPSEAANPDIFFGIEKGTTTVYSDYVILGSSVDFTAVGGIAFAGGGDGDFAIANATRIANMHTRYAASFDDMPTLLLLNEYRYPIDFVFDFGATQDVKDALVAFANKRKSTSVIIDTGTAAKTYAAIMAMRKTGDLTYNNEKVTIVGGIAAMRDNFTNKKIVMPMSFFEAYAIPTHINTYGGDRPFAGALYSYPNMIAGSYQPAFYDENATTVEDFVENQINFVMEDASQYTAFHQTTSLKVDSALAERNNTYLMHRMIRVGLLTAKAQRWNFLEDTDIEEYKSTLIQNIGNEMEGKLSEFELDAVREGNIGAARNRVLVTVRVKYKGINKGTTFHYTVT